MIDLLCLFSEIFALLPRAMKAWQLWESSSVFPGIIELRPASWNYAGQQSTQGQGWPYCMLLPKVSSRSIPEGSMASTLGGGSGVLSWDL